MRIYAEAADKAVNCQFNVLAAKTLASGEWFQRAEAQTLKINIEILIYY